MTKEPKIKPEKAPPAPRSNKRLASTKASDPPSDTTSPPASTSIKYPIVRSEYAHLPKLGDMLNTANNAKYGECRVVGLYGNFVETTVGVGTNTISMMKGTQFKMRLPPLVDQETFVMVLTVGEIWAKSVCGNKYRCAVVRRKIGNGRNQVWGDLETLEASAFPAEGQSQVTARTHTLTHTPAVL